MAKNDPATHLTLRAARAYVGVTMHELNKMIERGEVTGVKVATESGHKRLQLSIASLDAWKERRDAEAVQQAADQAA